MQYVKVKQTGKVHHGYVNYVDSREVTLRCQGYEIATDGRQVRDEPVTCKRCQRYEAKKN